MYGCVSVCFYLHLSLYVCSIVYANLDFIDLHPQLQHRGLEGILRTLRIATMPGLGELRLLEGHKRGPK